MSGAERAALEAEFAYTSWEQSCQDPSLLGGELRECRRTKDHAGYHASGFGDGLRQW